MPRLFLRVPNQRHGSKCLEDVPMQGMRLCFSVNQHRFAEICKLQSVTQQQTQLWRQLEEFLLIYTPRLVLHNVCLQSQIANSPKFLHSCSTTVRDSEQTTALHKEYYGYGRGGCVRLCILQERRDNLYRQSQKN